MGCRVSRDVPLIGGPTPLMRIAFADGLQNVGDAIERVVDDSFKQFAMINRTNAEETRRAEICTRWFRQLVNDERWTADRAVSELRTVLRCELDGIPYKPSALMLWAPDLTLVAG